MENDADLVSDSWRLDHETMRRNSAPPDPARLDVDEFIKFLDQMMRLAEAAPASPRPPAPDHPRTLI